MAQQSDIREILGEIAAGPMLQGGGLETRAPAQAFLSGGHSARGMRGQETPWPQRFDTKALRLPNEPEISRLGADAHAPEEGKEGQGRMSFVANIEARIAIINRMIPNSYGAARRALQKERADLEAKLRKVAT